MILTGIFRVFLINVLELTTAKVKKTLEVIPEALVGCCIQERVQTGIGPLQSSKGSKNVWTDAVIAGKSVKI